MNIIFFQAICEALNCITSNGDKSAPRLNVISIRNLFGSSKATCIRFWQISQCNPGSPFGSITNNNIIVGSIPCFASGSVLLRKIYDKLTNLCILKHSQYNVTHVVKLPCLVQTLQSTMGNEAVLSLKGFIQVAVPENIHQGMNMGFL